jgi:AmmeMemoRadiSam system protein B
MTPKSGIRPPAVAGFFYEATPRSLRDAVTRMLGEAPAEPLGGRLVALIAPHAGHIYSGAVAAAGFRLLKGSGVETVVIVAPSHREYFDGISVYAGSAYETPLGTVEVDAALRSELLENEAVIEASWRGHGPEHAIEVQLPFLQAMLPAVRILPIVMGDQRRAYCMHLGERLAAILTNRPCLLLASTDLSHYHPAEVAGRLDGIAIDDVAAFDEEKLMADLDAERTEACGGGPTVAVLRAAKLLGADAVRILDHRNSGDVNGDYGKVVGYLSAAIATSR